MTSDVQSGAARGCPAHAARPDSVPLHGRAFAADPNAVYTELRRHGPTAPVELAAGVEATLVTGYAAALEVLRTPELFSKDSRRWRALNEGRVPKDSPVLPMMAWRPSCPFTDGEEHQRLRQAVTDSLSRVDPNALRGYVERSVDRLIDDFGPEGEADLLGDYARVVPMLVLVQLLGCPADHGDRMVDAMAAIFDGVDVDQANADLVTCLTDLVELKRAKPGADVTSWLMAHQAKLTDEEMLHQLVLLMAAGSEPQQNLIANSLRLLLSDDRFAGDLSVGSLPVEDALDEVLWTDPPLANYAVHFPVRDVELGNSVLPEGEPLVVSLAAANTDPLLVSNERSGNRAHLSWGAGPHACPAQSASRLIASVAVEKLLDRLPDVELAVGADELVWRPGPFHRALTALPVRFPPIQPTSRPDTYAPPPSVPNLPAVPSKQRYPWLGPRRVWNFLVQWWRGR